jgi:signal transduction histidine kinase/uncharacterized protein YigA (DUF484 family)
MDEKTCAEFSTLMKGMSRGRSLRLSVIDILESIRRLSHAEDVRLRVHSSEVDRLLSDPDSVEAVEADTSFQRITSSSHDGGDATHIVRGEIAPGCSFARPDAWPGHSSAEPGQDGWQPGDRFWFHLVDSTDGRLADIEVDGTTDGSLLGQSEVARIRALADLAEMAISKAKESKHYETLSSRMKQRTDLLEDLLTISSSIVSERNPDALSKMILTSLSTLFGFQRVSLIVFDETIGEFRWKAVHGYPIDAEELALTRTLPAEVVLDEFAQGKKVSRSAYHVPFENIPEKSRRYFISSETVKAASVITPRTGDELREGDTLAFVLRDSTGRTVGAVYVSLPLDGRIPNKDTLETIEIFTALAEVTMEDARLSADREAALRVSSQRTEQLSRIFDLTSELMYVRDLDHMLDDVLKSLAQLLGLKRMTIGIRNDERKKFVVQAVYGYPKESVEAIKSVEYPIEMISHVIDPESSTYKDSPVKWRKKVGRSTFYIPAEGFEHRPEYTVYYPDKDLISHPRRGKDYWHELDSMDTFIFDRDGVVIAYIEILRPRDDRVPNQETIEVIETFAGLVGIAIENSRMFQNQIESRRSAEFYTDLLSHDIKNFNQAIMGYLDILRVYLTAPEQGTQIDKIAVQVMNVNRLANDVRTMSRLTWGSVNLTRVDIGSVLIESVHNVKMYYLTRNIEVELHVEAERYFVDADELLRELFVNILTNAVKYDSHEVVKIEITVDKESEGDHDYVTVAISDRGCGVSDDLKEVIFERFAKGIKHKGSSGLGLHIVSMLARRYYSKVWVEDRVPGRPDEGSVFKVRLPGH